MGGGLWEELWREEIKMGNSRVVDRYVFFGIQAQGGIDCIGAFNRALVCAENGKGLYNKRAFDQTARSL